MQLAALVEVSGRIAATSARLEKVALLADLLRLATPEEIPIVTSYLSGRLRQGRIGLGWASFEEASRAEPDDNLDLFAASDALALTVVDVDHAFERLEKRKGPKSAAARTRVLGDLMRRATTAERDFLIRLALGELRQGALAGVMEEAIARASELPVESLRRAVMLAGDLSTVAQAALSEGAPGLARFHLTLFQPIQPMLAQVAEDVAGALERLGEAGFEYKLDGARVQVHRSGPEVRVYSRRLNEVTAAVPELVEAVLQLEARELVLDGEVVAFDSEAKPLPFQTTMRRFGRRLDVERMRAELPLRTFLFDLLRLDEHDLLDQPARRRIAALIELAPTLAVPRLVTGDVATADAFYDQALAAGHEGLMAKSLDAAYQAGSRGFAWLKIKPAHTLDLVVLAVEWGNGRRQGRLSNIHLGARNPETGDFVMLGKTFKGMTDEMLAWQTERFLALETSREGNVVYVRPEQLVEVAFNDVQESPQYPAGLALRFARVKRYRDDKPVAEADTVETVRSIWNGQRRKARKERA
ncbi:MAG TPA: ATP-dependent DNA ligase [Candidatus Eisenbacteria bacterium]|nr:ATP-dependent DNA ligase [Candidatus Eisenbacteria bacterium]